MMDRENRTFVFGLILMFVCGISTAINMVNIERYNSGYIELLFSVSGVVIGYFKVIKTID